LEARLSSRLELVLVLMLVLLLLLLQVLVLVLVLGLGLELGRRQLLQSRADQLLPLPPQPQQHAVGQPKELSPTPF